MIKIIKRILFKVILTLPSAFFLGMASMISIDLMYRYDSIAASDDALAVLVLCCACSIVVAFITLLMKHKERSDFIGPGIVIVLSMKKLIDVINAFALYICELQ